MNCPRCKTPFSLPTADRVPHLHCDRCGARLFAWLGDHFGTRDAIAVTHPRRVGGTDWGVILLLVFAILMLLSCACLAGLTR